MTIPRSRRLNEEVESKLGLVEDPVTRTDPGPVDMDDLKLRLFDGTKLEHCRQSQAEFLQSNYGPDRTVAIMERVLRYFYIVVLCINDYRLPVLSFRIDDVDI
jgi:hypothetical protein